MSRFLLYNGDGEETLKITLIEVINKCDECRYKVNDKCFCNRDWKRLGKVCHFNKETCKYYKEEEN